MTSSWCTYCQLQTQFTSCSSVFSVSIDDFKQVKSRLGAKSHRSKKPWYSSFFVHKKWLIYRSQRGFFFYVGFLSQTFFFSVWVFFHEHSWITELQGKGKSISLTPHNHFHPLHRHLDISRAITVASSPLLTASSRTRTGNLWLPNASR